MQYLYACIHTPTPTLTYLHIHPHSTVVKSAEGDKLELDTFTYDVNNFDSVNEPTTCDGVLPGQSSK